LPFFGFESSVGRIEGGEEAEIGGVRVEREEEDESHASFPKGTQWGNLNERN
jgi:hypothetical protein